MDVGGRERLRQQLARLVRQEPHLVGLEPLGERDELGVAGAEADDHDREVVEVAQERRGADELVEVLRVADVAGVHDDEACRRARCSATTRCRAASGRQRGVSTQFGITLDALGARALLVSRRCIVSPIATTRSARSTQSAEQRRTSLSTAGSRAAELDRDLGEDVLADDDERRAEAAAERRARATPDDRRVRHADDDVGPRLARPADERDVPR